MWCILRATEQLPNGNRNTERGDITRREHLMKKSAVAAGIDRRTLD
jgi:hypothetical protein